MSNYKILFKVSSSIAAFKAVSVVSSLVKQGHDVRVLCSPASLNFVGLSTWQGVSQNQVHVDQYNNSKNIDHIELDRWADGVVLCPASASRINSMATGISNDLLNDTFLAHDFRKPYLIFPAMNTAMLNHPATTASIQKLASWGIEIESTDSGLLACGENGDGKLLDPEAIVNRILHTISKSKYLQTKSILITAGGTSEKIDQVRHISNLSSGFTGTQLAQELYRMGFEVDLVASENAPKIPGIRSHIFTDHESLKSTLTHLIGHINYDWVIHAAAVSDYLVSSITSNGAILDSTRKLESNKNLELHLSPSTKIIGTLDKMSDRLKNLIAFKLTSNANEKGANEAIARLFKYKHVRYVIHNDSSQFKNSDKTHIFNIFDSNLKKLAMLDGPVELSQQISALISSESNHSVGESHDLMS